MPPFVSCLCVSRPARFPQLQRAVADFAAQTYKASELVVVVDQANNFAGVVQAFVDTAFTPDIRERIFVLSRSARNQLDGLQQAAVFASGDVLALWDDDNRNHPDRLTAQVAFQAGRGDAITVMTEGLYLFHETSELFVVDTHDPAVPAGRRTLPTTMMAYRRAWPVMDLTVRGRPAEQMLTAAARTRTILPAPCPYYSHAVGVTHDNLRGYDYHRQVAELRSRPVSWLRAAESDMTAGVSQYLFWDAPLHVDGRDGHAFELDVRRPGPLYRPIEATKPPEPAKPENT